MFKVLFITFSGIAIGYLLRKASWLGFLPRSITFTIWLLLFFFGLQAGANELVVNNLGTLGLTALEISVACSLGSCVAAWLLMKFFFRGHLFGSSPLPAASAQESVQPEGVCPEQSPHRNVLEMLGGFIVVAFFAAGSIVGWLGFIPSFLTDGSASMYVLYALMVQVGASIGSDSKLKEIIGSLRPKLLLLPLGTIVGTLVSAVAVSFFIADMELADCLAVGAGFGYYSLSSVLISQIKEAQIGAALAAQLGTIALMANIMREVITLLFAPVICKVFGKLAPISVGGATSMDSTLPAITAACGKELLFISIFHGVLVDFSVPFLVTFFASL